METNPNNLNIDNDADKFYEEMDKTKVHQSCCTCQTLGIFFAVLLILSIVGILSIYYQITREKVFSFKLPTISINNFNHKLADLKPDQSGQIQITLTNEDMSALMSGGLSWQSFLLQEIQVQIMPTEMLIYGHLIKPIKSKVVISAMPRAKSGKINFEVTGVTAGNFNFPKFVNHQVGLALTNLIDVKLAPIYQKFDVQEVTLGDGQLTIIGHAK